MRALVILGLTSLMLFNTSALSNEDQIRTIDDYNAKLPYWGVTWKPGKDAIGRYYTSFYTGFATRSQYPERIHVRTSRGNQTRVTVILDENTLGDYLFDLAKRYEEYKRFAADGGILLLASQKNALPQLEYFFQVIESPVYGILDFVKQAEAGQVSNEAIQGKALEVISALNPGRVHNLEIDLSREFQNWKTTVQKLVNGQSPSVVFTPDAKETVIAINTLVFGRINFTAKPSAEILSLLAGTAEMALSGDNARYELSALNLFVALTGSKYDIKSLGKDGKRQSAIQCADEGNCKLVYSEFTAVYPTGSAESFTSDRYGNRIQNFATPGLWQFMSYKTSGRDFDNIRKEVYYAFAPKMDFEGIGNGFHNPAVSFWGFSQDVKQTLGIAADHSALAAVKRGGVSSGCLRLPVGHLWELRSILPVENSVATQVNFFGNDSEDFDLYDVNGDGSLEVMGVEYMISYSVKGSSGLAKRDGDTLEIGFDAKLAFYENLYGKKSVFELRNGQFVFTNPTVSFPSHLDWKKKSVKTSWQMDGEYPLFELAYERDKLQFYTPSQREGLEELSNAFTSKRIVRLMGRVRGCAPGADKAQCGEDAYNKEASSVWDDAH